MSGQFKTWHDAVKTKRQHKSPCSDCPFARRSLRGWLGNLDSAEWLTVIHGEGVVECHTTDKQCAGAAIMRANVCKSPRNPDCLELPQNKISVFADDREFQNHHERGK